MPDRIAKTRQSGEESSLREKVAQAILHVQETNRSAFPNNLELADAAIAVCMEEAAKCADQWTKPDAIRLAAGEMTAQELRTAIAVARGISSAIRSLIPTSEAE